MRLCCLFLPVGTVVMIGVVAGCKMNYLVLSVDLNVTPLTPVDTSITGEPVLTKLFVTGCKRRLSLPPIKTVLLPLL